MSVAWASCWTSCWPCWWSASRSPWSHCLVSAVPASGTVLSNGFHFKTTDHNLLRLTAQRAANAQNVRSHHAQIAVCCKDSMLDLCHVPKSRAIFQYSCVVLQTLPAECCLSCYRHCLLSAAPLLTPPMWRSAVLAVQRACAVSLRHLHLLMLPFHPHSDNFYGDVGEVKVAVRRQCSGAECQRLRHLAQQVRASGRL